VRETVTRPEANKETAAIRYLIEQRLKTRIAAESPSSAPTAHLDEDALCAFVEAQLDEAESRPIISHLVACASCRKTTAQLIRLESRFDEENVDATVDDGSGRVRQLLERVAAGLTPSFEEDVVFGYQSPADEPEPEVTDQTMLDGEAKEPD
jgi:hypothetical protein